MSLSILLFMGICWGCYRLGEFNTKHPGELQGLAKAAWTKLSRWMSS